MVQGAGSGSASTGTYHGSRWVMPVMPWECRFILNLEKKSSGRLKSMVKFWSNAYFEGIFWEHNKHNKYINDQIGEG